MEKAKKKPFEVRLSVKAQKNIDEISGYIALINHQPVNAVKVVDSIFKMLHRISQNPLAFKECSEIPTKSKIYRQAVCLSWLIIYKISGESIIVLGVIHKSRKNAIVKIKK